MQVLGVDQTVRGWLFCRFYPKKVVRAYGSPAKGISSENYEMKMKNIIVM